MPSAVSGVLCLLLCFPIAMLAQSGSTSDSLSNIVSAKLSDKYITTVGGRSAEYQAEMQQKTEKYLEKLKIREQVLQKQLNKIDSGSASKIFNGSQQTYDKLQNDLKNNSENVIKSCG